MSSFSFKRFTVNQNRCAMKVGTDGVLLGAWAIGGRNILDIGTGTGLISLMMAQRFSEAQLTAIDIDPDACQQACENIEKSPFPDRITVIETPLQKMTLSKRFDAIVSNPPYFVDSLKNPDDRRTIARHTETLSYNDLFKGVEALLTDNGVFSVVIPADYLDLFMPEAYFHGLTPSRICRVKTVDGKKPKRCLLSFQKHAVNRCEDTTVCLQETGGGRSEWYRQLTSDFYL